MMQERTWRRTPSGAGVEAVSRRHVNGSLQDVRTDVMSLDVEEYAQYLREAGCSEKMIQREVLQLSRLQAEHDLKMTESRRKRRHGARMEVEVDSSLDAFVQAEVRRTAGVAADDVLEDLRR